MSSTSSLINFHVISSQTFANFGKKLGAIKIPVAPTMQEMKREFNLSAWRGGGDSRGLDEEVGRCLTRNRFCCVGEIEKIVHMYTDVFSANYAGAESGAFIFSLRRALSLSL